LGWELNSNVVIEEEETMMTVKLLQIVIVTIQISSHDPLPLIVTTTSSHDPLLIVTMTSSQFHHLCRDLGLSHNQNQSRSLFLSQETAYQEAQ